GRLPRAGKLRAVLAVTGLVLGHRALQREHAGLLDVVLLQEVFVRLELLLLQVDGALFGGDLRADRLDLGDRLADLRAQRRHLAFDRLATRAEQRALALQDFRHAGFALRSEERRVGKKWRARWSPRRPG